MSYFYKINFINSISMEKINLRIERRKTSKLLSIIEKVIII